MEKMTDQNKEALEALEWLTKTSSHPHIDEIIDRYKTIRAALQAQVWQPIENYVKKPYHVMVYTKNGAMMFATMYDHIWYGSGTSGVSKVRLQDEWTPTHFMPLPQPPKVKE